MPSPSADLLVDETGAAILLDIADTAIVDGLGSRTTPPPELSGLPVDLRRSAGVFVTLTVDGALNGCIGTIEAAEPLGQAVARLARAAAFSDPRLPALTHEEYSLLDIEISILSPLSPIPAASRAELLAGLRPGIDGLVIEEGGARALFLPTVWEQLPEPDDFLDHLHHKAGIAAEPWPPDLRAFRFMTQIFSRHAGTPPTGGPG